MMDVPEIMKEAMGGGTYFKKRDGRYFVDVIIVLRALSLVCRDRGYTPSRMNLLPLSSRAMKILDLSPAHARFDMGALWNISVDRRNDDTREVYRMRLNRNGEFTIECT